MKSELKSYSKLKILKLLKKEYIPWASYYVINRLVENNYHILEPLVVGAGNQKTRYSFDPKNVERFLTFYSINNNQLIKRVSPIKLLTVKEIYESGVMPWVRSYTAIRRYIKVYEHIFKPIRYGPKDSGGRVFIDEENLDKFIETYTDGKIK